VPAGEAQAAREAWVARLGEEAPVIVTSSATGLGLDVLAAELLARVPDAPVPATAEDDLAEHITFRPAAERGFRVERTEDGAFRVVGRGVALRVAALRRASDEVVVVTSGAIAVGMRVMELAARPREIEQLQAASAVGQGKLFRVYDELLLDRGVPSAQVLLTFFDMSARLHYLNA